YSSSRCAATPPTRLNASSKLSPIRLIVMVLNAPLTSSRNRSSDAGKSCGRASLDRPRAAGAPDFRHACRRCLFVDNLRPLTHQVQQHRLLAPVQYGTLDALGLD